MTKQRLGWIAGLFDGEGCCRVQSYKATKNGVRYLRARVQITNTHLGALQLVQREVGYGDISTMHGLERKKNGEPRKPCFNWGTTNQRAVAFLKMIRPHLVIKADAVDKILASRMNGRA